MIYYLLNTKNKIYDYDHPLQVFMGPYFLSFLVSDLLMDVYISFLIWNDLVSVSILIFSVLFLLTLFILIFLSTYLK